MNYYIGQVIVRFWLGERYDFERTESGGWKLIKGSTPIVPQDLIDGLPK